MKGNHFIQQPNAGFTLVEIIISIVLAGIIAVGVIQVAGQMTSRSANPMIRYQAVAIAESYLDEVLAREFTINLSSTECDNTGLTRSQFTSICHYHNLNDNGAKDQVGDDIDGLGNYNVSVTVAEATLGSGSDTIRQEDSHLITVTVTAPGNTSVSVSAYRTNF